MENIVRDGFREIFFDFDISSNCPILANKWCLLLTWFSIVLPSFLPTKVVYREIALSLKGIFAERCCKNFICYSLCFFSLFLTLFIGWYFKGFNTFFFVGVLTALGFFSSPRKEQGNKRWGVFSTPMQERVGNGNPEGEWEIRGGKNKRGTKQR